MSVTERKVALLKLRQTLDRFYREYDFEGRLRHDPIELPHRYKEPGDVEVAGFIASCLAYGRVGLFKPVAEGILERMGGSPGDFVTHFSAPRHRRLFQGVRYRFNTADDIVGLIYLTGTVVRRHGSIEGLFKSHWQPGHDSIGAALGGFVREFLAIDTSLVYGKKDKPPGLLQFFPSPEGGSTCKRMNLFLRWMIRDKDIDFGIWRGIPKNRLIIPLDTHIARISRCLGLTGRVTQDWKMAVGITESLKKLDPVDPLKYDFALCHHGISGVCSEAGCADCRLLS